MFKAPRSPAQLIFCSLFWLSLPRGISAGVNLGLLVSQAGERSGVSEFFWDISQDFIFVGYRSRSLCLLTKTPCDKKFVLSNFKNRSFILARWIGAFRNQQNISGNIGNKIENKNEAMLVVVEDWNKTVFAFILL